MLAFLFEKLINNHLNIFEIGGQRICCKCLKQDVTVTLNSCLSVRLCKGVFWYYLEELSEAPALSPEKGHPLEQMSARDVHKCALKVLVHENRVAVELFHSLTDGNGGLVFLKTLIAEYLEQLYGISVPSEKGVLDRREEPHEGEMEDSFIKYKGDAALSRRDTDAFRIKGAKDPDGFSTNTAFLLPVEAVHREAKKYGVSITAFLTAALTQAAIGIDAGRLAETVREHLMTGKTDAVEMTLGIEQPQPLDWEALAVLVKSEVREPGLDLERDPSGNTILPGQPGRTLDVVAAKALVDATDGMVTVPVSSTALY